MKICLLQYTCYLKTLSPVLPYSQQSEGDKNADVLFETFIPLKICLHQMHVGHFKDIFGSARKE